jgi:leucyl-tRNA synthetase
LDKVWRLQEKLVDSNVPTPALQPILHKTIKGVGEDYEAMKFNTAIAKMMILANELTAAEALTKADFEPFLQILHPVAPHVTEEIWSRLGHDSMMMESFWPSYDESHLVEATVEIVVNVNGKVRDRFTTSAEADSETLQDLALKLPKIRELVGDQPIRKVIVVPKKLVNIVL